MSELIKDTFDSIFFVLAFPLCVLVALMDVNNGKGFKTNLKLITTRGTKT